MKKGLFTLLLPLFVVFLFTSLQCKKNIKDTTDSGQTNPDKSDLDETEDEDDPLPIPNPIEQQAGEDDWTLPDWVKRSENSGIIFYDFGRGYPTEYENIPAKGYRWRDLNPEEGVYNWNLIQNDLNSFRVKGIHVRLGLSDTLHVPRWVFNKYPELRDQTFFLEKYNDIFGVDSKGYFTPIWHLGLLHELKKFFAAFKEQGFAANPKLHHFYAPGAWTWGEYGRLEDKFYTRDGLTPNDYIDRFKELIDYFAGAFEGYEYKVVYTGHDVFTKGGSNQWRDEVGRKPSKYIVEKGFGWRSGMLEQYNFLDTELPNYGHSLFVENGKNYIVTDDENPMVADTRRVTANENEAIGYGSYPSDYYNLKMSVLKQLQLRLRFSYSNYNAYRIDPSIHHYFQMTAGKQYDDSPDAWCALREASDIYQYWTFFPDRKDFYFSNWERWLYQREVEPNGKTKRVYYIDNTQTWAVNGESYEARTTNTSDEQNYIYFDVDDKFMHEGPYKIQIKVTYLDNFKGKWELQYQSSSDVYQPISITNASDNKWKTITFDIDDDYFANGQTGGNDFRLYNGGKHDLVVRFVRVIKTIDPALGGH